MIDNIELIKPLLSFTNDGDFYMLYIFKRKKDQPEGEKDNHQSSRTIKTYCIDSFDYLDKRYDEIKMLCEVFKARAYIQINKQNHHDVTLELNLELAERMKNKQYNQKNIFDSVVGQLKTYEKRWVIDIDTKDEKLDREIQEFINTQCTPYGMKILANIPTKNGHHLITDKFYSNVFEMQFEKPLVEIKKKNPTLLYLPNSLD